MAQPSTYEQYLLELINAERAKVGAQPLASMVISTRPVKVIANG